MARSFTRKSIHVSSRCRVSTFLRSMRRLSMRKSLSSKSVIDKQEDRRGFSKKQSVYRLRQMHRRVSRKNSTHAPNKKACSDLRPVQWRPAMCKSMPRRRMECAKESFKRRPSFQALRSHSRRNNQKFSP